MDEGVYIVTGASKGIGKAIAIEIAKLGFPVVALARDSNELKEIGEILSHIQERSSTVPCDLSEQVDVKDASEKILHKYPSIAGIVHNAGTIHPVLPFDMASRENWSHCLQVNLIGVQDLTQRLVKNMGGNSHSRITAISSGASLRPVESWSAYCVSKAGLDMWVRCVAHEQRSNNISAISVAPGIVNTKMQSEIRAVKPSLFPDHSKFVSLHVEKKLSRSEDVAQQLLPLITQHSMAQSGERFDVREL